MYGNTRILDNHSILLDERNCLGMEERVCLLVCETPIRPPAFPSLIHEVAKAKRLFGGLDSLDFLGQGGSFRFVDMD